MKYIRRRYILVYSNENISKNILLSALKQKIIELFGAFGIQKSGLSAFKIDEHFFIVRSTSNFVDDVLFALATIKMQNIKFLSIRISGTIKKLIGLLKEIS